MQKGASLAIRFNPRTKEYEVYDNAGDGSKPITTFPDYPSAIEYYKERIREKNERN